MQAKGPVEADMLVKDVIEQHPQTIAVFVRRRLNCVGCYIAPFHTITDTAREHALTTEVLLWELNQSIREASREG